MSYNYKPQDNTGWFFPPKYKEVKLNGHRVKHFLIKETGKNNQVSTVPTYKVRINTTSRRHNFSSGFTTINRRAEAGHFV